MNWNQWFIDEQTLIQIGISIAIFFGFLFLRKLFSKYLFRLILKVTKKTPTDFLSNIWVAFEHPIRWFFVVIGLYLSVKYFPYFNHENVLFLKLYRSTIVVLITWGFFNLTSTSSAIFHGINKRLNFEIDKILIPFFSKTIRVVIIAIGITIIAEEFDYNISTLIAGLGLGGLAFALAAQDALKNLFGGVVIILERPFSIGDWILTSSVEGTVEDITFRSTKIRTSAQALVTVPNSTLANDVITNWSKMGKRRIDFNMKLDYSTPLENMHQAIQQIREMLENHPGIHKETIFVTFDKFAENGFELLFYFFTNTTVWGEYLEIKQDINMKIMEILHDNGIELALPSQLLYVNNPEQINKNKRANSKGLE